MPSANLYNKSLPDFIPNFSQFLRAILPLFSESGDQAKAKAPCGAAE